VDLIAFLGVHADDPAIVESQRDLTKIDIAGRTISARLFRHRTAQRCSQRPRQPMASFLIPGS
jgi:hypothetical protein